MRAIAIIGAERPFGTEIVARLAQDGCRIDHGLAGGGPLDALVVNMPVILAETRFADITDDQFRSTLDEQIYEPAAAAQAAAARLVQGGAIVHIASRAHLGGWGGAHQMAAGAALIGLSRSMALEFADAGVRVNVVAPGFPGERWDTPEARAEIADVVAFLIGPGSTSISGETILLDRGTSLRMTESARR